MPVEQILKVVEFIRDNLDWFTNLCVKYPFLGFLILFLFSFFILASILKTFRRQLRNIITASFTSIMEAAILLFIFLMCGVFSILTVIAIESGGTRPVLTAPVQDSIHFASPISLEWEHHIPSSSKDTLEYYIVQWCSNEAFKNPHQFPQPKPGHEINIDDNIEGRIYWRVRPVYKYGHQGRWSHVGKFTAYRSVLSKIKKTKQLIVGTSETSDERLFAYYDSAQGRWTGIDIELVRLIIERLEIDGLRPDPEVVIAPWNPDRKGRWLFQLPSEGEVDLLASGISNYPRREDSLHISFSVPYFTTCQSIVTLAKDSIRSTDQIKGKIIGALNGTTNYDMAATFTDTMVPYKGIGARCDAFRDLKSGKIIAFFDDRVYIERRVNGHNPSKFRIIDLKEEQYALAVVSSEKDLLEEINKIITSLIEEGKLEELAERFVNQKTEGMIPVKLHFDPSKLEDVDSADVPSYLVPKR